MYGCESWTIKKAWAPKNWCFQIVVLEKTPESPLDSKEIKSVNTKRNQLWVFTGRTDAEAEASVLWPPDAKSWLTGKDPDSWDSWLRADTCRNDLRLRWRISLGKICICLFQASGAPPVIDIFTLNIQLEVFPSSSILCSQRQIFHIPLEEGIDGSISQFTLTWKI